MGVGRARMVGAVAASAEGAVRTLDHPHLGRKYVDTKPTTGFRFAASRADQRAVALLLVVSRTSGRSGRA